MRKDIAAVKAQMPKVFHDVACRALYLHGSLGVSNEMPFSKQITESFVMGLADGPTEVHKITVAARSCATTKAPRLCFRPAICRPCASRRFRSTASCWSWKSGICRGGLLNSETM